MYLQRYDIISKFISARGYTSFLEIGTNHGDTFRHVSIKRKVSVDPDPHTPATVHMTSDEFFAQYHETFDIIFIDGLHEHNQVKRDIQNSLAHLNPNGVIVMHDCTPNTEEEQRYSTTSIGSGVWLGTVWKAYLWARATLPYEVCVYAPNAGDSSCGIIDTSRVACFNTSCIPSDMEEMTWKMYVNRPDWLNIRPVYDFSLQTTPRESVPRVVFMSATRSWYHRTALSLKSFLKYNYVDHVYLLIEDDFFPEPLPPFVHCVNVSDQKYFPSDGPNYESQYSYMVLLRVALPLMFPGIHKALLLDSDTITHGCIKDVWSIDLTDMYFAAAKELKSLHKNKDYYNAGVMLMNFDNLRRDLVCAQSISRLNTTYYSWKEQDVLNDLCRHHIFELPPEYNRAPGVTSEPAKQTKIRHYIGGSAAKEKMRINAAPYEKMSWDEIVMTKEEEPDE